MLSIKYNMLVTSADIEKLILDAKTAGAPPDEIQELQEHLEDIKSGKLMNKVSGAFVYEKVDSQGRKVLQGSTAPIFPEDDDDFKGLTFQPIKSNISRRKLSANTSEEPITSRFLQACKEIARKIKTSLLGTTKS